MKIWLVKFVAGCANLFAIEIRHHSAYWDKSTARKKVKKKKKQKKMVETSHIKRCKSWK